MSSISLESFIYSALISLWAGLTIMWIAFWRVDWINLPAFLRNICWIIFPCLTSLLCHWSLYACILYSNIQLKEMSVWWKMLKILKWQSKANHSLTDSTIKFFFQWKNKIWLAMGTRKTWQGNYCIKWLQMMLKLWYVTWSPICIIPLTGKHEYTDCLSI